MRFWLVKRKVCMTIGVGVVATVMVLAAWYKAGPGCPATAERAPVSLPVVSTADHNPPADKDPPSEVAAPTGAGAAGPYAADYYVECRLERERSRGRQIELLRTIMSDPKAGAAARQDAQDRLLQISLELDREVNVENILRAKGLQDVVVFFQNEMVTVVVPHPVTPEQNAAAANLAARAAGVTPENILVITRDH